MMTYNIVSANLSSAIRLFYTVRLGQVQDVTYLIGKLRVWMFLEMTSGFLALCLPVSPKFCQGIKNSSLWSSVTRKWKSQPFLQLKPDAIGMTDLHPGADKVTKGPTSSGTFRALFKKYNILQGETDLVSKSKDGNGSGSGSGTNTRNESFMESSPDRQITRLETGTYAASTASLRQGASNV